MSNKALLIGGLIAAAVGAAGIWGGPTVWNFLKPFLVLIAS